jgi:L-rhamnose mutarotase
MGYVALHSVLEAGRESEYDVAHERIPDDLARAHRRAGIEDWWIWRSGRNLFHLVDCEDFETALRLLEHDPANERWQAFIGEFVERFEEPNGDRALPLVWRMQDQA